MLKNLIIIENGQEEQYGSLEELAKALIDEKYYEMDDEDRKEKMTMKALANTINNRMEIVQNADAGNIDGKFIIKDEVTYILSLISLNRVMLLERIDANIFAKDLNKENMKDNYIILNKFAKELLAKYLNV